MKKLNFAAILYCLALCLLLAAFCLVTCGAEEGDSAPKTVNVKDYGAVGDGVNNDTPLINEAVTHLKEGDTLYFPEGTYLLKEYGVPTIIDLNGLKNVTVMLHENAILQMDVVPDGATGEQSRHYILHLRNCENVTITGGKLYGDLASYKGTAYIDHGYAIRLADCEGITVKDVEIAHMRGDGISVFSETVTDGLYGGCRDVLIEGCEIYYCFRNGITLTSVDGCVIRDTYIHNIRGGMPQAGIDIEAEYSGSVNRNITIENCRFIDCYSWSVVVARKADSIVIRDSVLASPVTLSEESADITFTGCTLTRVGVSAKKTVLENCKLECLSLYGGEATCTNCEFDGKGTIPYRVLVTKSYLSSKGTFENCTFRGRGLCALGGCIVFCHTPPESMTFTDCDFNACGLIPFLGYLTDVEREGCFFNLGWALWLCIIAVISLVAFLIIRHNRRRVWVCR